MLLFFHRYDTSVMSVNIAVRGKSFGHTLSQRVQLSKRLYARYTIHKLALDVSTFARVCNLQLIFTGNDTDAIILTGKLSLRSDGQCHYITADNVSRFLQMQFRRPLSCLHMIYAVRLLLVVISEVSVFVSPCS